MDEMTDGKRMDVEEDATSKSLAEEKKYHEKRRPRKVAARDDGTGTPGQADGGIVRGPGKDADDERPPPKGGGLLSDEPVKKVKKNGEKPSKGLAGILGVVRDVAVSAGIVVLILVSLFAYTGVWPPMVVIESNSMMHGGDSQIGVIDTGDLTLVKSIKDKNDVVTYVEATCATNAHHGFKSYGDFGNVIVYRKNGLAETPVIHRAIAWIEYNVTASNPPTRYRGDIPDIGIYNVSEYRMEKVGYQKQTIIISLDAIFRSSAVSTSRAPHGGFVTHGDHNPEKVDQESLRVQKGGMVEPVKVD